MLRAAGNAFVLLAALASGAAAQQAFTVTGRFLYEDRGWDWNGWTGAWTERPSETQAWFLEKQKTTMQKPLHDELLAWYEKDAGKTTVNEIADLVER